MKENYQYIKLLNRGCFGVVSKIKRKSDGRILVWKELNYGKMTKKEKEQLVAEVNILRELEHPNIVRYYDRIIEKQNQTIYIVMEYCEGGDILQLIKRCKRDKDYMNEDVIWKIFMQIMQALQHCHFRKEGRILHRDIKPGNIFLDGQNNVKLGDFGLSKMMGTQSTHASTHVGTPYYMSPEQIDEVPYNEKSDIWSAGCVLYEMAALRPPFMAKSSIHLAQKIKKGEIERIPMRYSWELQEVIQSMLNLDYKKRPTAKDLLRIEFINLRVRERKERERYNDLKRHQEKLKKAQKDLHIKEKEYLEKKEALMKKEDELKKRELALTDRKDSGSSYKMPSHMEGSADWSTTCGLSGKQGNLCFSNISIDSEHTGKSGLTAQHMMQLNEVRATPTTDIRLIGGEQDFATPKHGTANFGIFSSGKREGIYIPPENMNPNEEGGSHNNFYGTPHSGKPPLSRASTSGLSRPESFNDGSDYDYMRGDF